MLEAFFPGFVRARGSLLANVDVRGTVKQPIIDGQFRIKDGAATLSNLGLELQRVNADILLERDTMFIQRMTAETNRERRGTIGVDGFVSLEQYSNQSSGCAHVRRTFTSSKKRAWLRSIFPLTACSRSAARIATREWPERSGWTGARSTSPSSSRRKSST